MLHGWGMHSGVWHPLVKRLAQHYILYLVDLPGMGGSRPIEPYHLHSLADEVAASDSRCVGCGWLVAWWLGGAAYCA